MMTLPTHPLLRDDPVAFTRDVLRDAGRPYHKQIEILDALQNHDRVAVVACNSSGKDWLAARGIAWWLHTRPEAKVVVTAPTLRQAREITWRELRIVHNAANLPGTITRDRYEIDDNRFAMIVAASSQHNLQGFHSPNLLVVVSEAQGVNQAYFEALKRLNPRKVLLLGNPLSHEGELYDSHHAKSDLYHQIHIGAGDSPNFLDDESRHIPGIICPADIEERRRDWGDDSPLYIASVLGLFPDSLEDSLTARQHVDRAIARHEGHLEWPADLAAEAMLLSEAEAAGFPLPHAVGEGQPWRNAEAGSGPETLIFPNSHYTMGVDVARYGADESVICIRRGPVVEHLIPLKRGLDTMQVADEVKAWADALHIPAVFVDESGVGGGVVDRLTALGVPVFGVDAGGRARRPSQFADMRAEIFWEIGRILREDAIAIPNDPTLVSQLLALRYEISSTGRIRLESKSRLRKRGIPSPDRADALALAFMTPPSLQIWF